MFIISILNLSAMASFKPPVSPVSYIRIIAIAFIVIGACSKKNEEFNTQVFAAAGNDSNVLVGETVTLNGNGSSDLQGNALEYSWQFVSHALVVHISG